MKNHPDPLITQARSARMELSARFGHDFRQLCTFLRKEEQKHTERLAKGTPSPRGRRQPTAA